MASATWAEQWVGSRPRQSWRIQGSGARGCVALLVLNLLDGVFTLWFLLAGLAEELNPLMRWAFECSPLVFMMLKLGVVNTGVLILWLSRPVGSSRVALWMGVAIYAGIVVYHLSMLGQFAAGGVLSG